MAKAKHSPSNPRRLRDSTHLIPIPGLERRRPERYLPWYIRPWLVIGTAIFMGLAGICLEIALRFSQKDNGFKVPARNVFAPLSVSFLTSFFPIVFVVPLAYLWFFADEAVRWYQPYVDLSHGNARAETTLLLDYIAMNRIFGLIKCIQYRHWIVFVSILTGLAANLFQPLAGAIFSVKQLPFTTVGTANSVTLVGLNPDFSTLSPFLAAAGFTEAAAFQGLPDPPFVRLGWATAQFQLPDNPGLNATIAVNTTGIRTQANCANPTSLSLNTSNPSLFTMTGTAGDGCVAKATFNPADAEQQYGTTAADAASCGAPGTPQHFLSVMFWFFHNQGDQAGGAPQAVATMCRPSIEIVQITAMVNLNNGALGDVLVLGDYTTPNNVTGAPLNGQAFNAVTLSELAGNNSFVQARATAIQGELPGAMLRFASQTPDMMNNFFNSDAGPLPIVNQIYTRHLSVSAKSVYFLPEVQSLPAVETALVERLVMDALASHGLAVVLILICICGIGLHVAHIRARRHLYLTYEPGTIAASVAMTSHSGFGQLVLPYDDTETIRRKLAHLRFSLDRRTGAIVADEYGYLLEDVGEATSEWDDDGKSTLLSHSKGGSEESDRYRVPSEPASSMFPIEVPYEHEPLRLEDNRPHSPSTA